MVKEIADREGRSTNLVSRHWTMLRQLGLVEIDQRLHTMPPHWIADREKRVLDLGYCVLRLDALPK